jgi:hypothetical protein
VEPAWATRFFERSRFETRSDALPPSLPLRGLSHVEAAAYVGISPTKFQELVRDGLMPAPKHIDSGVNWDGRLACGEPTGQDAGTGNGGRR